MSTILRKTFICAAVAALAVGASFATSSAFAASRMPAYKASPYAYEGYYGDPNGTYDRSSDPTLPDGDGIHYDAQGNCHGWKCDF